jgi:hypothetical protein
VRVVKLKDNDKVVDVVLVPEEEVKVWLAHKLISTNR